MNIGEFNQLVKDAIGRGDNFSTSLVTSRVRQAVRWLEKNTTFKYMERFVKANLNPNSPFPHIVSFPSPRVKYFSMLRLVLSDGTYKYLKRISPKDVSTLDSADPSGYWLLGRTSIVLDSKPTSALSLEMLFYEFTDWSSEPSATHWLLDNGEAALFCETMLKFSTYLRDPKMLEAYKAERDEELQTLIGAEDDLLLEDSDDSMIFDGGS